MGTTLAMSGLCNRLPDFCTDHDSEKDAVESLIILHNLSVRQRTVLRDVGFLYLSKGRCGSEYCQVVKDNC